jgi:hypothetical protein
MQCDSDKGGKTDMVCPNGPIQFQISTMAFIDISHFLNIKKIQRLLRTDKL